MPSNKQREQNQWGAFIDPDLEKALADKTGKEGIEARAQAVRVALAEWVGDQSLVDRYKGVELMREAIEAVKVKGENGASLTELRFANHLPKEQRRGALDAAVGKGLLIALKKKTAKYRVTRYFHPDFTPKPEDLKPHVQHVPSIRTQAKQTPDTSAPGFLRADEVYAKDEFLRRMRMSKHAYATAKRNGLPIRYVGNRVYILGRDWFAYLESRPPGQRDI